MARSLVRASLLPDCGGYRATGIGVKIRPELLSRDEGAFFENTSTLRNPATSLGRRLHAKLSSASFRVAVQAISAFVPRYPVAQV
jgi:hypothetical protein